MRRRCSGIAATSASTSRTVATGRSAGRSTPPPATLQGEESKKPSVTAVFKIAESSRYAFAAVEGCARARFACQLRIPDGARPINVAFPSDGMI